MGNDSFVGGTNTVEIIFKLLGANYIPQTSPIYQTKLPTWKPLTQRLPWLMNKYQWAIMAHAAKPFWPILVIYMYSCLDHQCVNWSLLQVILVTFFKWHFWEEKIFFFAGEHFLTLGITVLQSWFCVEWISAYPATQTWKFTDRKSTFWVKVPTWAARKHPKDSF